jgi:hypothetical protein
MLYANQSFSFKYLLPVESNFINENGLCIFFLHNCINIYIKIYINFNVTQQDTQRKLPDGDVHTSKHVGAVECISKLSE